MIQVTIDDVLIIGHGTVKDGQKKEQAIIPKDVNLILFSPPGVAINQSLVAEIVAQKPIDILVTVNKKNTQALPGKYRQMQIFTGRDAYIDIPDLWLAPMSQEERQKAVAGAKPGQLILEAAKETELWRVLEQNKAIIAEHKKTHGNMRIFWLACSNLQEEEEGHPTLIGNVPAAMDFIRYTTIADTKIAIELTTTGQAEKGAAMFQGIETTSTNAKKATTI